MGVGSFILVCISAFNCSCVCVIVSVNDVRRQPNERQTPQTWQPSKVRGRSLSADERLTDLTRLFMDGRRVRSEATSFLKGWEEFEQKGQEGGVWTRTCCNNL